MAHMNEIYLDHAATTPVHPDVLGLMLPFFGNHFGIPGDPSHFSDSPREAVKESRSRAASLIGAEPQEIIFTSGGTESANMAVLGVARAKKTGHIITSATEHACVLNACRHLETDGFEVTCVPVTSSGMIDPASVENAVQDDTILISIMHVNNEVGTVQPIREIGSIAKKHGILFHCDAVQSAGKIAIDVNELRVDLLSFSSHKLYGPKGMGALYIRHGTRIEPVSFGSGQEMGHRPGTLNVPGIVGFGKACEVARTELGKNAQRMKFLRDKLENALLEKIPDLRINGLGSLRAPHILSVSIPGIQGDALAAWLDLEGIIVSAGASLFSRQPSHVLTAMGIPAEIEFGTVRFSPGWENTEAEIIMAAETVADISVRLREFTNQVGNDETCIVTFSQRDDAKSSANSLRKEDIPFAVTIRPVELSHLKGTRIAVAFACSQEERVGALLGGHGVDITGMHHLKSLCCRERSKEEEKFWEKVSRIKKDMDENG
jgi:cysteine desulfurase